MWGFLGDRGRVMLSLHPETAKNLREMQPGVRVFPVHGRSLIYIYMERERLNFVVKAVGICEQCIL